MSDQLAFNFEAAPGPASGLVVWREQRKAQIDALAVRSGLPIGHAVRIWLANGILVEGCLVLAYDELWVDQKRPAELHLQIGRVDFRAAEIESCVRID